MVAVLVFFSAALITDDVPQHLAVARKLVDDLRGSSLNAYGGGKRYIEWGPSTYTARTVCSSFATLLLQHSYGWTNDYVKEWIGLTNPEAENYHDAIGLHKGFLQIVHLSAIKPGDYLAVKYTDHHESNNGVEDTGHVMLVDEAPQALAAKAPLVPGTKQYFVTVIDSSASGHGTSDTRHIGPGKFTGGIGRGVIRLYADGEDRLAGYTWSDEKKSPYYTTPARDMVIGRLDKARLPR